MAEFLVRAKKHYKDDWDAAKVASLTPNELADYNARSQIGDIIVVKTDGWTWGSAECLPDFLVIKVPSLSYASCVAYESVLMSGQIILKRRKFRIPEATVLSYVTLGNSVITLSAGQANTLKNNIITKVS